MTTQSQVLTHLPPACDADRPLAVFDLDGTLVRGDTFLPFLYTYGFRHFRLFALALMPVYVGLYVGRLLSARTAKQLLLRAFFRGQGMARINGHATWFCERWVQKRLRPDVIAKLREHQAAGHRVILLSASPDVYVPAIGKYLDISEVVCTRVLCQDDCSVGTIDGHNCKGEKKVEMLVTYLAVAEAPAVSYAYGDCHTDLPILRWSRHGFLVGREGIRPVDAAAQECQTGANS